MDVAAWPGRLVLTCAAMCWLLSRCEACAALFCWCYLDFVLTSVEGVLVLLSSRILHAICRLVVGFCRDYWISVFFCTQPVAEPVVILQHYRNNNN